MATIPAARSRRRCDRSLGQIPLSSSEIELYSRQDEATRRRRRLLAVRDEERRLAQQMTLRYRNNLQKLQHKKLQTFQKELNIDQQKMLKELHTQYQNSLHRKGTEQRDARLKLLEFMEQAQKEKEKGSYNCQIAGKGETIETQEGQKKEAVVTTARLRQVEQKRERVNVVSNQQGRQASAGAQQEQDVAMDQKSRNREELEMLRRMQSSGEVVVTPRWRQNDGVSYRFTRTDCGLTKMSETEKPAVTVVRHDRNEPTAMRGKNEAMKYRDEIGCKREVDRLIVEAQQKKGLERGRKALNKVVLRRQGLQAMEWLALVDKMERRARGQELGGGEDYSLDAGDVDGGMDKSERMAEQAFAEMLGLDGDSIELSVFSINSNDERSVADPDHELVDGDEAARADSGYRENLKGTKRSGSFDLRDRSESVGPVTRCQGEQAEHRPGKPLKATSSLDDMQHEELEGLEKPEDMRKTGLQLEGIVIPSKARSEARDSEDKDPLNMSTRVSDVFFEQTCSRESHSSIVAVDDEDKDSILKARLQDLGEGPLESDLRAGRLSGAPSKASSIEDVQSKIHSENTCSEVMAVERDGSLHSISASENGKDSVERNAGQLENNCGVGDRALLEKPCSQREWCTTRGDQFISDTTGHRDKYGNAEEKSEGTIEVGENGSALHRSNFLPQSLVRDEVNEKKVLEVAPNLGKQISTTGRIDATLVEGAEISSASFSTSDGGNHEIYKKGRAFDGTSSRNVAIDKEERLSLSGSFAAPSQKSLSQLDPVANNRARSLKKLFVDQQMMSFSDPDGLGKEKREMESISDRPYIAINSARSSVIVSFRDKERLSLSDSFSAPSQKSLSHLDQVAYDRRRSLNELFVDQQMISFKDSEGRSEDEIETGAESHRLSISTKSARSSAIFSPRDLYCQQIHYEARRSSTSAVSVAQYSLPSSDTQNSFDDSLDQLHLGHDDSFVNELVPMFPKHTVPPPPRSLEEDNQVYEEYDVQLVAPNMSRMLTSEQLPSFRGSDQRLIHEAAATGHLRRQPPASTTMQIEGRRSSTPSDKSAHSSSFSRQSYSDYSSCKLDAASVNTSVEQSPVQQHKATGQIGQAVTVAAGSNSRRLPRSSQPPTGEYKDRDAMSDISSESGVSSLGWSVDLNIAAGTTRRRDTDDDGQVIRNGVDGQHDHHAQEYPSDDEVDKQSIASERSFASSSSMSMDAYFNYIIAMTSTVGNSLPLPTMMYSKKNMTKRPAPMTWSTSSVSSVTTASKVDLSDDSETSSLTARRSVASSDPNDTLLELQHVHPCSGKIDHLARDRDLLLSSPVSYQSEDSDASRASGRMRGTRPGKAARFTFTDTERKITELLLSSVSSRSMSQSPALMQNLSWSSDDSASSDGRSTDDSHQHHFLPPPMDFINTHQRAASMQRFGQSLDDSQSSYQNFRHGSFQRRGVRRRPHHHSYDAEEECKQDDSSSESSVSSHSNASCGSSAARSCRQRMQKAENMEINSNKSHGDNCGESDGNQGGKELTLAEAFQRRHPGFVQRGDHHHDKLERQQDKQRETAAITERI